MNGTHPTAAAETIAAMSDRYAELGNQLAEMKNVVTPTGRDILIERSFLRRWLSYCDTWVRQPQIEEEQIA